jgi:hypothetical protein
MFRYLHLKYPQTYDTRFFKHDLNPILQGQMVIGLGPRPVLYKELPPMGVHLWQISTGLQEVKEVKGNTIITAIVWEIITITRVIYEELPRPGFISLLPWKVT